MPEYLAPGVYVNEIVPMDPRPFTTYAARRRSAEPDSRVRFQWSHPPTVVAAFLGMAPVGPAQQPVLVRSWAHYVETFGGRAGGGRRDPHLPGSYLSWAIYGYFLNGGTQCYVTRVVPSAPHVATSQIPRQEGEILDTSQLKISAADIMGDSRDGSGLEGLARLEDINVVSCPDLVAGYQAGSMRWEELRQVQLAMIFHCEMHNAMAILDPPPDLSPDEVLKWRQETAYDSTFAALYYPWITIGGEDGRPLSVPPSGHIAGVWARNDMVRGIHKAPASGNIHGAIGLAVYVGHDAQNVLNPGGVNALRAFPGRGIRVWGTRTLSSDPSMRYIQHRRLLSYVADAIRSGTDWAVFEPLANPSTWAQLEYEIGEFLRALWNTGALSGRVPEEAYYVRCDEELNLEDTLQRGRLLVEVGLRMDLSRTYWLQLVYQA